MTQKLQRLPSRRLLLLSLAAVLALAALTLIVLPKADSGAATIAKKQKITGTLSKGGYTVIALDEGGEADTDVATPKFKLRPTAKKVTLHLRKPDGTYGGPIVVGKKKKGKRVIVGVKKGADLGKVKVKTGAGYAKPKRKLDEKWLDEDHTARATDGVPIGAGNFGRVAVSKLRGPSSDGDLDGVPFRLDIDDDGDLVLDDVESDSAGAADTADAARQTGPPPQQLGFSVLNPTATGAPINANVRVPGFDTDAAVEATLVSHGLLNIASTSGFGSSWLSGELDCGGLSYCSPGGTGKRQAFQFDPDPQPFPACCDPDGDGFGSLDVVDAGPAGGGATVINLNLLPGAQSDQIAAGDVLLIDAVAGPSSEHFELTSTLASIFATVPALASYTDELGNEHPVPYPLTENTALPVRDGPDAGSDISARLNFWRPQRRAIPEEAATGTKWIDMGGLWHYAQGCPASAYSEIDSELDASEMQLGGPELTPVLTDGALDRPASPDNSFSYTLNLTQCRATGGGTFDPGQAVPMFFHAVLPSLPGQPSNGATSGYAFHNATPQP